VPYVLEQAEDLATCAKAINGHRIVPIFLASSVTGMGMESLKRFLHLLPKHRDWAKAAQKPCEFAIDGDFSVDQVGTVVSGTVMKGSVNAGETLLLGPTASGAYEPVTIKGVHVQRTPSKRAVAGQAATIALKDVSRDKLRRGMALLAPSLKARAWALSLLRARRASLSRVVLSRALSVCSCSLARVYRSIRVFFCCSTRPYCVRTISRSCTSAQRVSPLPLRWPPTT
jgi:GTPase